MSDLSAPPRRKGRRRTASPDLADPIDRHVGARVRLRRTLLGLSQHVLAQTIGLTFQQVQKYERGANRISASMLHHIAQALDVPISFFFDGTDDDGTNPLAGGDDDLLRRETLELLRRYYSMPATLRRQVYELVKAMAGTWGNPAPAMAGSIRAD